MHRFRSNHAAVSDDLLGNVVEELLDEIWLLCFDEFMVLDIGDAMIIKRLFEHLFAKGMVMVTTSNRPPDDLYYRGLNREYFVPFIPFLKRMCNVHNMDSSTDYRLMGTQVRDRWLPNVPDSSLSLSPGRDTFKQCSMLVDLRVRLNWTRFAID